MFFFKKKQQKAMTLKLQDVVPKVSDTGYVFWNINDDMGKAAQSIQASGPLVLMAYGYARRAAMAALHVQNIVPADAYAHAVAMFRSIQQTTGHTREFQEQAAQVSIEFMQTYQHMITGKFVSGVVGIANGYELPPGRLSDADLFSAVTETIFQQQEVTRLGTRP